MRRTARRPSRDSCNSRGAPGALFQLGDQGVLYVGDRGAHGAIVQSGVVISIAAEAGDFAGLGAGVSGSARGEENVRGTDIDQPNFDFGVRSLHFRSAQETGLAGGAAAKFRDRADNQCIDADQTGFVGYGLFRRHLVEIGSLEDQELLRGHQPCGEHVRDLLAQGIVVRIDQEGLSVAGLVCEAPDGDLAFEGLGSRQCGLPLSVGLLSRGNGGGNDLLRLGGCRAACNRDGGHGQRGEGAESRAGKVNRTHRLVTCSCFGGGTLASF